MCSSHSCLNVQSLQHLGCTTHTVLYRVQGVHPLRQPCTGKTLPSVIDGSHVTDRPRSSQEEGQEQGQEVRIYYHIGVWLVPVNPLPSTRHCYRKAAILDAAGGGSIAQAIRSTMKAPMRSTPIAPISFCRKSAGIGDSSNVSATESASC